MRYFFITLDASTKWVQHPFKIGTHALHLTQMGFQSERALTRLQLLDSQEYNLDVRKVNLTP